MKIQLTEGQLSKLMVEIERLSKDVVKDRLALAKELAKEYPNPRKFALEHNKLWNFIRAYDLIDVVFPNRIKQVKYDSPEDVIKIARTYATATDLKNDLPNVYSYVVRHKLLDKVFPYSDENQGMWLNYDHNTDTESSYVNPSIQKYLDHLIDRASRYKDMKDLEKRNPELYRQLTSLGHDMEPDTEFIDLNEDKHSSKEVKKLIDWSMKHMGCYYTQSTDGIKLCPPDYVNGQCRPTHLSDKALYPMMRDIAKWFGCTKHDVERAFRGNRPI